MLSSMGVPVSFFSCLVVWLLAEQRHRCGLVLRYALSWMSSMALSQNHLHVRLPIAEWVAVLSWWQNVSLGMLPVALVALGAK